MKNIPAKNILRVALTIAMLFGLNLTTYTVFAQDTDASEKIQLLSEALLLVTLEICFLLEKKR